MFACVCMCVACVCRGEHVHMHVCACRGRLKAAVGSEVWDVHLCWQRWVKVSVGRWGMGLLYWVGNEVLWHLVKGLRNRAVGPSRVAGF